MTFDRDRGTRVVAAMLLLSCLFGVSSASFALERIYLVRHAEKQEHWPSDRALGDMQPLNRGGVDRAEALAQRMAGEKIAAVYATPTTRTLSTGLPTSIWLQCPLQADDRMLGAEGIAEFVEWLKAEVHAEDEAVLIVGHSNTIPHFLHALGAEASCRERLGITEASYGDAIEGYDGLWRIELGTPGCAGMERLSQGIRGEH